MRGIMKKAIGFGIFSISILLLSPTSVHLQEYTIEITDLLPIPFVQKEFNPKMEYQLYRITRIYQMGGIEEARKFATLRNIDISDNSVRLVAEVQSEGIDEVATSHLITSIMVQIENLGGYIEGVDGPCIQSFLPLSSVQLLADLSSIRYLRIPVKMKHLVTSEGVSKTGANHWHSIPAYRSDAANICILDLGFEGYESLLGNELPSSVITRSFRGDNSLSAGEVHGTACAEIVHDMAADARLTLVNFSTSIELSNAVDWTINQGIDIISASFGSNYYPGDGTGPSCEAVKRAYDAGIMWVNAAGNEAEDHWAGTYSDYDGDWWHNFYGADEILAFDLPAYVPVSAFLRWDDWGSWDGAHYRGSNQDYDLYLYILSGSNWLYVDKSENFQTGWQDPVEYIYGWYSSKAAKWGIAIRKYSSTRQVKFDAFISNHLGGIEYNRPSGSIICPADSQYSFAVGAVDWADDSYHTYSSQGPTADGRIKPDICAPSAVTTVSYEDPFYGTSSACPHVSGAFALLKGKTPFSLGEIQGILESRAIDLGSSGKDTVFGIGRLNLMRSNSPSSRRGRSVFRTTQSSSGRIVSHRK